MIPIHNGIVPFATTWMDWEGIVQCEISVTERHIPYDHPHTQNPNNKRNKHTKQTRLTNAQHKLEIAMFLDISITPRHLLCPLGFPSQNDLQI